MKTDSSVTQTVKRFEESGSVEYAKCKMPRSMKPWRMPLLTSMLIDAQKFVVQLLTDAQAVLHRMVVTLN